MWMLRLKTGLEITEKELSYWDNVPADVEITALALALHRHGGQSPFIVEITGYEEVCCATMAQAGMGGSGQTVGRGIFCVRNNSVNELRISNNGISLRTYPREKLELRPSCLRKMVG
ncbi:hypothetical protein LCGC14_2289380 [marine sediment metagenome]|uniref:Uncharacterized protein n=1 Tax=marine sediment metagenome TaxID=412755 RepID=A0A0F9FLV2_9ZZZZ